MSKQCNTIIKTIQNSPRRNISLRYWTRLAGRVNTLFAKKLYNFTKNEVERIFLFFFLFFTCSKFIHRNDRGRSCKLIRNTDQSSNGNKNKINQPIQHHHLRLSLSHELAFFPRPTTCHADSATFRRVHSSRGKTMQNRLITGQVDSFHGGQ